MPGAILPNIGIQLPQLGGDIGTWDDELNQALTDVDDHDHTAGNGLRIRTAALDLDADVTLQGHGLTDARLVALVDGDLLDDGSTTVFVHNGELYYRNAAGQNTRVTNAGQIDVSGTGGIVGDYTAAGAEVAYDDVNKRYTFKRGTAGKPWARLASGDVRIYETDTTESVFVGLAVPAALAGSYTITLPLAIPGTQSLLQLTTGGVMLPSNIVPQAVTFSGGITVPTIAGATNFTGAVDIDGTLEVDDELTMAAGKSVKVSGAGRFKHGVKTVTFCLDHSCYVQDSSIHSSWTGGTPGTNMGISATEWFQIPMLPPDVEITEIRVWASGTVGQVTARAHTSGVLGMVPIPGALGTNAGGPPSKCTLTPTVPHPVATPLFLRIDTSGTGATQLSTVEIDIQVT